MHIEFMLAQISDISKKYDLIYQKTGGYFNIFDIANMESDEIKICRVIYELLNPKGSHYQGDCYLRLFVKYVLKLDITELEYKTVRVFREYVVLNDRRIDLVIETESRFIPIEVKIYARDQQKQCFDYCNHKNNFKLFYLTLNGRAPSPESAKDLTPIYDSSQIIIGYQEVSQISFETEIIIWLNKCLGQQETIKIAPIREVMLQLIATIRKLTNQMEEGIEMEIINTLSASKENMKSAIVIEKSLKHCKNDMIKKVLKAIEDGINKEKLRNQYDYEFDNFRLVKSYYERKGSSFPGISYYCKSLQKPGVDLWFRIEIDYCIFAGFCTPNNDKACGKQFNDIEVRTITSKLQPRVDGWWTYWEYLPKNDEMNSPNFKQFDEEYLKLYDETTFCSFVEECVNSIKSMWNKS